MHDPKGGLILFLCVGHSGFKAICLVPYGHISLWVSSVSQPFYRPTNSSCQILPVSLRTFLKCHPKGHSLTPVLICLGIQLWAADPHVEVCVLSGDEVMHPTLSPPPLSF